MISSIRVAIFDLGNTLIYAKDPWPPFFDRADAALIRSLADSGLSINPSALFHNRSGLLDLYNEHRGNGVDEETTSVVLKQLLVEHGYSNVGDNVIAKTLRAMYAVTQSNWYPEEDALPTLQRLKARGFQLGLISNAADNENTQTLIDKGGFRPYLEFIVSSAAFGKRKPHPAIFQLALDHFHVEARQAVMVGDLVGTDIAGANQVGMKSIWITRRAAETATKLNVKPDAVVSTLREIPPLLSVS
jgi:HAD superfamily hydrolase (TIGR01662 family)